MYQSFKASVLGKVIGDGECVALVRAYTTALFPGVNTYSVMPQVTGAKDLAGKSNQYITWVANDHNNPNQIPAQGNIMVFDATPEAGYANTFDNPYGHTGVCDSANSSGYSLLQQNSPNTGSATNVTSYAWKFRPCLGWYVIGGGSSSTPTPPPAPAPTEQTITLPKTTGPWHLRERTNLSDIIGIINPIALGRDLTYAIQGHPSEYIYWIDSPDYGPGAIDVEGSTVHIS